MSVPVWELNPAPRVQSSPRAFLACVLTLLLAMALHAQGTARNETSFAKTRPGHVQNVSIRYKTARVAEVVPLHAVSPEAPSERDIAVQPRIVKVKAEGAAPAQPVSAAFSNDVQPQELAVVPRFAKADDEAGSASPSIAAAQREAGVAIYDIERGMVYLPNGERLEAHSGMGPMRDNPSFVDRRNRGPTPPHIYDLTLREKPFHGVEAIRLTPVEGEAAVFGRVGFLAHTYMLRRPGDSNGCVVFKDYRRFLAAFKKGQIKRMAVVPRLKGAPASILTALLPAKNG
jgi:type VI secretion system (T6SS) effector TldE1-like protein